MWSTTSRSSSSGDAVLGFVIADLLYREFPQFQEGQKSKAKAAMVSTAALAALAERIGLGEYLLLGRGEEKTGGRRKQALLADGCEALIAALYLDGGIEAARDFLLNELADEIAHVRSPDFLCDYKSALQERLQSSGRPLPVYVVTAEVGPEHDKRFHVTVRVGARRAGRVGRQDEEGSGAGGGQGGTGEVLRLSELRATSYESGAECRVRACRVRRACACLQLPVLPVPRSTSLRTRTQHS